EKGHWERRIIDLGGHNYSRHSAKMTGLDGNIVHVPNPSGRGPKYRYFGAAKKLPGARELFEKPPELQKRRMGFLTNLIQGPAEAVKEWQGQENINLEAKRVVKSGEVANAANILFEEDEDVVEEERKAKEEENQKEQEFVVHVPLPDEREIEKMVLAKKKQELLSKYTSDTLMVEQSEANAMLNIQR
ncbi:hypothetical protein IFM89_009574, partial [Coptis chinensis]